VTSIVFGKAEYAWRPTLNGGSASPDGPPTSSIVDAGPETRFLLPAASVVVLRAKVSMPAK
jgi:hypothetical protein